MRIQRQISASERQQSICGHNKTGRQSDCQSSCHSTGFVVVKHLSCSPHTWIQHNPRQMTVRAEFKLSLIIMTLTSHACTHRLRLEWCCAWSTRNCTDWGRIVLSDESHFQKSPYDNSLRIWRCPKHWGGSCPDYHTPHRHTTEHYGLGCHLLDSRTSLIVIFGTLTAQRYVDDILPPVVLPFLLRLSGLNFQQDDARPHTKYIVMNCLQACCTIPWPATSLDLSPMQHIWDVIRRRLQASRNIKNLVQQLKMIWHEILQDTIQ